MSYSWLFFALGTVATWGLYGIFLHSGQMGMGDPVNGRYKAFLFVGIAYVLVAVLAPVGVMLAKGSDWNFPVKGMWLSLVAGILGAVGAFFVLLALGALVAQGNKNAPAIVMSIIFAGAPVVNAIVALTMHPPKGGWGSIPAPFYLGIVLAATGGCLVTLFKPSPGPAPQKAEVETAAQVSPGDSGPENS